MTKNIFDEGTYWYMTPTVIQFSETYTVEEHEKSRKVQLERLKEYSKLTEEEQVKYDEKFFEPDMRTHPGDDYGRSFLTKNFIHPLVLFAKSGKLVVAVDISEEYEKNETPYVTADDFMFCSAIPRNAIYAEIEKKIGVKPKMLHHLGLLDIWKDSVEVDGLYAKDFCADDEDKEECGDGLYYTSNFDALVCTDWDGEFKFDDGFQPASIGFNELDKYGLDYLIKLFGNLNNYYAWAKLLFHAGVLDASM